MIKEFVEKWNKNKGKLEKYFSELKVDSYIEYKDIVKAIFDLIINDEDDYNNFNTEEIVVLDHGNYQGTQIFILHKSDYQPGVEEYVYTNTYYGSCSGCDTLLGIICCDNTTFTKQQVADLMTLSLHLLQKCCYMKDGEDND